MMLKTRMEVAQDYSIFNYGRPIPKKDVKYQDRTIMSGPGVNTAPIFLSQGTEKKSWEVNPT